MTGGDSRPERSSPAPLARATPEPARSPPGVFRKVDRDSPSAPSVPKRWTLGAKTAQNAPRVPKNGTLAALRRSSPELAIVRPSSRVSPKSQGYGEAPESRQNRAGRGALESAVAGVGLHGWPISGTRARLYAPQAPGTRVSLYGFGGRPRGDRHGTPEPRWQHRVGFPGFREGSGRQKNRCTPKGVHPIALSGRIAGVEPGRRAGS